MATIVKKPGRKAYDSSEYREPLNGYELKEAPSDYVSHQRRINSEEDGTINQEILDEYLESHNYEQIDNSDVEKMPSGSRIAYITVDNKWRSGGFLSKVETSTKDFDGNKTRRKNYLIYKAFGGTAFSVQFEDVEVFYTQIKQEKKVIIKKVVVFKKQAEEDIKSRSFPVKLKNSKGDRVLIYYAKDAYNRDVFINTQKFKKALEDPDIWEFDDGTQTNNVK